MEVKGVEEWGVEGGGFGGELGGVGEREGERLGALLWRSNSNKLIGAHVQSSLLP